MLSACFLFLLSSVSAHILYQEGQLPQNVTDNPGQYNLTNTSPAIVLSNIRKEVIIFNVGNDPIALSIFSGPGADADSHFNCSFTNMVTGKDMDFFFDLLNNPTPTVFTESFLINCLNRNPYGVLIMAQPRSEYVGFASYFVRYANMAMTYISQTTKPTAFTIVSLTNDPIRIFKSDFLNGSHYDISDSTPKKAPTVRVDTNTTMPLTLQSNNKLFTTFFFSNTSVDIGVDTNPIICPDQTDIKQTDHTSYFFPTAGKVINYQGFYSCNWNFIPINSSYYPEVTLTGTFEYMSSVTLKADDGFGVIFGSDPASASYYRGFNPSNYVYPIATGGSLYFQSTALYGTGNFTFNVTFKKFESNKPILDFSNSSMIDLTYLNKNQIVIQNQTSASILYVALNLGNTNDVKKLDNCFATLDNVNRVSLREFYMPSYPKKFTSAQLVCPTGITTTGRIVVTPVGTNGLSTVSQTCARIIGNNFLTPIAIPATNRTGSNSEVLLQLDPTYYTIISTAVIYGNDSLLIKDGTFLGKTIATVQNSTKFPINITSSMFTLEVDAHSGMTVYFSTLPVMQESSTKTPKKSSTQSFISIFSLVFVVLRLI